MTSTSRYHVTGTYTTAFSDFDDAYRPKKTTLTVPGFGIGGTSLTYTVESTYKDNGAVATTKQPGVGGLPEEALTYGYTTTGQLKTLAGTWTGGGQTYVANSTYLFDGLPSQQWLGAAGKQVRLTSTFDDATRRLSAGAVALETSPSTFTSKYSTSYSYDNSGNIASAAGSTNGAVDQVECFRHDYLRRLTEAWTQATLGTGCSTPQRAGADPYWRQWTPNGFDTTGNRLTQIDNNPVGTNTTWTYHTGGTDSCAGTAKAHQLRQVDGAGPLAEVASRTFCYDAAGNMTKRTTEAGTRQDLVWDKEGHLSSLTEAGVTTTYVYDSAGNRLLSKKPGEETLYLPDGTELEKINGADPLGQRYYGSIAVRNASGLKWIASNHQGSSTIQIDATTMAHTRRRFLPYGEPRGAQPTEWLGTKGFVGGTKDDAGLTHLGAREYDPSIGRFISVDPLFVLGDPRQYHAYQYAVNSPVSNSDPSGLKNCGDDQCGAGGGGSGKSLGDQEVVAESDEWGYVVATTVGVGTTINGVLVPTGGPSSDEIAKKLKETCSKTPALCDMAFYCPSNNPGECGESWAKGVQGLLRSLFGGDYGQAYDEKLFGHWRDQLAENLIDFGLALGGTVVLLKGTGGRIGNWWKNKNNQSSGESCPGNSFDPNTQVLMADGTAKKIKDVEVGDQVLATDPRSGVTDAREVTHLIVGSGLKDLIYLSIHTDDGDKVIIATVNHPFWSVDDQGWIDAGEIDDGLNLLASNGKTVRVVRSERKTIEKVVHNLTVADIHTYYVLAGNTPVLVHNDGGWTIDPAKSTAVMRGGPFGAMYYQQAPDSKGNVFWWSPDKAGHGGSAWKVYRETATGLEWYADADANGDFMENKYKGEKGKSISFKDLKTVNVKGLGSALGGC